MLLVYIKTCRKKIFLCINENNNDSHQRKTTCTFLWIQVYIYIQKPINYAKIKTICVTFLFTKIRTLYVTLFWWFFIIGIYIYTKIMARSVTWRFYIQNPDNLKKARQFALRFLILKSWHFVSHNFSCKFWKWQR